MQMKSFISDKAEKGKKSEIEGLGLFAIQDISKGEVVAVKAGHILTLEHINQLTFVCNAELQVAHNLFVCPSTKEELPDSMIYINHSCEPNVGMRGDIVFVAMRDIKDGEELTIDYAMIDNYDYKFECKCRTLKCRKIITGYDWKKDGLERKYLSSYIQSLLPN